MKRRRKGVEDADKSGDSDDSEEDESQDEISGDGDKMEWGKKVELELQKWIETDGCQRDVADEYFNNPHNRKRKSTAHF
jgi:hypothetical protein